jgi:hypothetical protein
MRINLLPHKVGVILCDSGALNSFGGTCDGIMGFRTVRFVSVPPQCFDDPLVDNSSEMTCHILVPDGKLNLMASALLASGWIALTSALPAPQG